MKNNWYWKSMTQIENTETKYNDYRSIFLFFYLWQWTDTESNKAQWEAQTYTTSHIHTAPATPENGYVVAKLKFVPQASSYRFNASALNL